MSVMQAMAWARPVLATRAGGLPEWVVPHPDDPTVPAPDATGWLVPVGDARALADAMHRCLLSPSLARATGLSARARILAAPPPSAMLQAHIGLYAALLPPP